MEDALQKELDMLDLDEKLQALTAFTSKVRKTKRARQSAAYENAKYHGDPEYRQKHNQKTTAYITHKYATDPEWRAKVREQQREYYYKRKAAKTTNRDNSCESISDAWYARGRE